MFPCQISYFPNGKIKKRLLRNIALVVKFYISELLAYALFLRNPWHCWKISPTGDFYFLRKSLLFASAAFMAYSSFGRGTIQSSVPVSAWPQYCPFPLLAALLSLYRTVTMRGRYPPDLGLTLAGLSFIFDPNSWDCSTSYGQSHEVPMVPCLGWQAQKSQPC